MPSDVDSADTPDREDDAGREEVVDRIGRSVARVSLGFGRWTDPHARGPGLYFVVESDSVAEFTDPMGTNRWPVGDCESVFCDADALFETARVVALSCDGAVVVHGDGTIAEEMVRFRQLSVEESTRTGGLPYAGWMGTRHMSALETSTREAVFAAVTLSEEDGRVTVFRDGTFVDYDRDSIGEEWSMPY